MPIRRGLDTGYHKLTWMGENQIHPAGLEESREGPSQILNLKTLFSNRLIASPASYDRIGGFDADLESVGPAVQLELSWVKADQVLGPQFIGYLFECAIQFSYIAPVEPAG